MDDLLKKFLYTGVGLAALTTEKLQETVDELVGKGKVSKDEGKKIIDDFVDRVEDRRGDFEKRMQEMVDNFTASINLPKMATNDDLSEITRRLEAIEAKLGITTAEDVKTAVENNVAGVETEQPEEVAAEVTTTAKKATKTASRAKKTTSSTTEK